MRNDEFLLIGSKMFEKCNFCGIIILIKRQGIPLLFCMLVQIFIFRRGIKI